MNDPIANLASKTSSPSAHQCGTNRSRFLHRKLGRIASCYLLSWLPALFAGGEPFTQPDGTAIELKIAKHDGAALLEDMQGFTALRIPVRYEYALLAANGGLEPSGIELGTVDPCKSALPLHARPTAKFLREQRAGAPPGLAPPSPHAVEVELPDGSAVARLKLKGSGPYSWYEDEKGYAVVTKPARFEYALRGPQGQLVPCGILVGSIDPSEAGLKPGIRPR